MNKKILPKKILLGITGGIAAYKSAELVRLLKKDGAEVKVVLTQAAMQFITPITLQALSGEPVYTDLFMGETDNAMSHIALARWADVLLVAPATADTIAKFANGHASDLLSTLYLATQAPVILAPAMNQHMWSHAATQHNVECLKKRNVQFIGPDSGEQACGDVGVGRMLEPECIVDFMMDVLDAASTSFSKKQSQVLLNKKMIITAGPTREPIDPVRYISNHSSGKMGYAMAQAAIDAGAEVILISGPTDLVPPPFAKVIYIDTAESMLNAVLAHIDTADMFIGVAAVSDYRVAELASQKIKKTTEQISLSLIPNPDILSSVSKHNEKLFVVGFAAETEQVVKYARDKLLKKNVDMMIANDVSQHPFGGDENAVWVIDSDQEILIEKQHKNKIAHQLMEIIAERYHAKQLATNHTN